MLQPWVTSGAKESISSTECAIQVVCRADQGKVCECLGKVSQCFSVRSCFFSEQPEVIGIGQHFLEDQPRVFEPGPVLSSRSSQGLDEPECANVESAVFPGQPIQSAFHVVTVDQTIRHDTACLRRLLDGLERRKHSWIGGAMKNTSGMIRFAASSVSLP